MCVWPKLKLRTGVKVFSKKIPNSSEQFIIFGQTDDKMKKKHLAIIASALLLAGCGANKTETVEPFWLGADISWETAMEQAGEKLYNFTGDEEWECTALMQDLGLNAVRLRVWVDPQGWERQQEEQRKALLASLAPAGMEVEADGAPAVEKPVVHAGSCDKEDLLEKAIRARDLGMAVMVDFHYSDSWADPGKQPVPLSWKGHSYEQMKDDLRQHTVEVLELLKENGVEPRWVQLGNETSNGLLWSYKAGRAGMNTDGSRALEDSIGRADICPANYAGFIQAGHDAVKSVFPKASTIVHLDNGWDSDLYEWNLGILEKYGVDYDMIGMSLYPYWAQTGKRKGASADAIISECIENIKKSSARFGKDVMIVETGFQVDEKDQAVIFEGKRQLQRILKEARDNTDGRCKGVFYWEPECRPSRYQLGAFTSKGRPTAIMQAWSSFEEYPLPEAD